MGASTVAPETTRNTRAMTAMGATVAVALVAALAITLTPRQTTTTTAISATTMPPASALRDGGNTTFATAEPVRTIMLSGATAVPKAISDVPSAAFQSPPYNRNTELEAVLPDLHDQVIVLTEQFAYSVAWRDVSQLNLTESAVVVDHEGTIVGLLDAGRLTVSHDLRVGATINLD